MSFKKLLLLSIFLFLISFSSASLTLDTARIGILANLTESNLVEFDLQSTNNYNYSMNVNIISNNFTDIDTNKTYNFPVLIKNQEYILNPNQTQKSHVTVQINTIGRYSTEFTVFYTKVEKEENNRSQTISLISQIQILAIRDEIISNSKIYILLSIITLITLILLLIVILISLIFWVIEKYIIERRSKK